MGTLEVVKKGFTLSFKLVNIILIFFVFNVIIGLINMPVTTTNPGDAPPPVSPLAIASSIIFFFLFIFLQGGAMASVKDLIKTGTASLSNFMDYGKKYYLRILGLLLLYILIAVGVVLILALISAGVLLLGDNVATRSIVAVIVTVVAIGIITFLVYPIYVVVVEDCGPIEALKKGIQTSKANFKKTLGIFALMLGASLVVSLIVGFVAGIITIPLGESGGRILLTVVNSLVQSYIPIVMMIAFMSLYISLTGGGSDTSAPANDTNESGDQQA